MRTRGSAHVFRPCSSATKVQSNLYFLHKTGSRIRREVSWGVSNKASIRHAIVLGLIFGSGIFLILFQALRIFAV